jgi:membrane-associated phospholipid phosphatase
LNVRSSIAIALGTTVFLALALLNAFGTTMIGIDLAVANALHAIAIRDPGLTRVVMWITMMGNGLTLTILTIASGAALVMMRRYGLALGLAFAMLGTAALNLTLKIVFHRPRPTFLDPVVGADGWSFPSGHSMGTIVAVGMLAYLLFEVIHRQAARRAILLIAGSWAVLMAFSRVYLGVHYFSDVLGGLAAGGAWLAISIKVIHHAKARALRTALAQRH